MDDPTIICPQCRQEIKLTESLAGPLLASARAEYEKRLAGKDADIAAKEKAIREREEAVRRAGDTLDQRVAEQVRQGRAAIAADEARKARLSVSTELEGKSAELKELREAFVKNNEKLAAAQKAQADLLIKQRELDDARREMELTIQKQVQNALQNVRDKARQEVEEVLKLKLAERDETIAAMNRKLEEAQKKAEQGSQQLQGEVLELQLQTILVGKFPLDIVEPVPKGEHGGDILQRVVGPGGQRCGTILWETKRTKNWSDGWLAKLREDQRAAKAEMAIIVSQALPEGLESFDHVDGIWVVAARCAMPMAVVLRMSLMELAAARQAADGQQSKMELVYQYLTGPRFKQRVHAIVEKFTDMHEDLEKERKAMTRLWAKREEQIRGVLDSTAGLYGDLQGIAGRTLGEIEGLEMKMLDAGS